jgi:hypothetical protein
MLRDEGSSEVGRAPDGKTVFCKWSCASLNALLNARPTIVIAHVA